MENERISNLEAAVMQLNGALKQQQARSMALMFGLQAMARTHPDRQSLFDAFCDALDQIADHPAAGELVLAYGEELRRVRDALAGPAGGESTT